MDASIPERNSSIFEETDETIDCLFISNFEPGDANFFVVTGARGLFVYSSVVVYPDGTAKLVVHDLEQQDALANKLDYLTYSEGWGEDRVAQLLTGKQVGINERLLPVDFYNFLVSRGYQPVGISSALEAVRMRKTKAELEHITHACDIVSTVARKLPTWNIHDGMTEHALRAEIEYEMTRLGSEEPAFPTVVAFGVNTANPHHRASDYRLKPGDLILIDLGARCYNLVSDLTRTFCYGEEAQWQRELYHAVLKAQRTALHNLQPGVDGAALYAAARDFIRNVCTKLQLAGDMTHGLGHAIGYFVHDGPRLNQSSFLVPEGLVTTVEPGAYVPGLGGIRIEDDVFVQSHGIDVLTSKAPKDELICLS